MSEAKIVLIKDDDATFTSDQMKECPLEFLSVCKFYEISQNTLANVLVEGYNSLLSVRVITEPLRIEEFSQCGANKGQSNLLMAMLQHIKSGVLFDDGSKKGKRSAAAAGLPAPGPSAKKADSSGKSSSSAKSKGKSAAGETSVKVVDDNDGDDDDDEDIHGSSDADVAEKSDLMGSGEALAAEREELLEVCRANFGNKFSSHVISAFKAFIGNSS
jgi:hypothetical protein